MYLNELLLKTSLEALKKQKEDGSMPPGHNGPYFDKETPVRNTAHWLYVFCNLYERDRDKKWKEAADRAADYLLSEKARPMGASFWIMKNPEKDFCNGVVGQAWIIEAMVKAGDVLNRKECYSLAEKVFLIHPFDEKKNIWRKRVNVDGSFGSLDTVFNHQLWLAMAASLLYKTPVAKERAMRFLDNVGVNVELYGNGVIYHRSAIEKVFADKCLFSIFKRISRKMVSLKRRRSLYFKSVGYHSFNLYALAVMKEVFPEHSFWISKKFKKMLECFENKSFKKFLENNEYGLDYNVAGIEIAYILQTFKKNSENLQKYWLEKQFKRNYDFDKNSLCKNTDDSETLSARIYEATRIKNINLFDGSGKQPKNIRNNDGI